MGKPRKQPKEPVNPNLKIYRGWLVLRSNGEESHILHLATDPFRAQEEILLAQELEQEIWTKPYLTVRYYITDQEVPANQLTEILLQSLYGKGEAKYGMRYSEITGYLWTDEKLQVGGHDLLQELKSHIGKYCHLEILFSSEPEN